MAEGARSGGRMFIATVLVVVGVLWMALAGLCSAAVLISSFMGQPQIEQLFSVLPIVLLFGTIGAAPGMLIWLGGRALWKRRNSPGG